MCRELSFWSSVYHYFKKFGASYIYAVGDRVMRLLKDCDHFFAEQTQSFELRTMMDFYSVDGSCCRT